jgi:steroid delta-isomerase
MMGEKSPAAESIEQKTRAALEAYADAWACNDRDALLAVFAPDASWEDPAGTPPWHGHAKIGEFWDMAHTAGTTLKPVVHRIVTCGAEGILLFRMEVRMPGGGGMGIEACDHMIVNAQGKIQSGKAYWDQGCVVPLD